MDEKMLQSLNAEIYKKLTGMEFNFGEIDTNTEQLEYYGGITVENNDDDTISVKIPDEYFIDLVERDASNITSIMENTYISERLLLKIISRCPEAYQYIDNPSDIVTLNATAHDVENAKYLGKISETLENTIVKKNPIAFQYLKTPHESTIRIAAKRFHNTLAHIDDPSVEIMKIAVRHFPYALKLIKNPPRDVQIESVTTDGMCIRYISNPSKDVIWAALNNNPYSIKFIEQVDRNMERSVIDIDPNLIMVIRNPSYYAWLYAIEKKPELVKYASNRIKSLAIDDNPELIQFIKTAHPHLIHSAVTASHNVINLLTDNQRKRYEEYLKSFK